MRNYLFCYLFLFENRERILRESQNEWLKSSKEPGENLIAWNVYFSCLPCCSRSYLSKVKYFTRHCSISEHSGSRYQWTGMIRGDPNAFTQKNRQECPRIRKLISRELRHNFHTHTHAHTHANTERETHTHVTVVLYFEEKKETNKIKKTPRTSARGIIGKQDKWRHRHVTSRDTHSYKVHFDQSLKRRISTVGSNTPIPVIANSFFNNF